jgi:hypothetical protein
MTDDMLTDTDKAEEQLYAAIDMGDMEHGSDDSIYIVSVGREIFEGFFARSPVWVSIVDVVPKAGG